MKNILTKETSPLFQYIKPDDNDKLSEMSGIDLQDLLILIDDYYLELRNTLGFDKNVTFGLELEFEEAYIKGIKDRLSRYYDNTWKIKNDSSLKNGAEINSPILQDNKKSWLELKNICLIVGANAIIGKKAGGHIHIGTQVLGEQSQSWLNFIKLWSVYENIIFRFTYGEFLTFRPDITYYAEPLSNFFWKDYEELIKDKYSLEDILKKITYKKFSAVNFNNVYNYNTISERNTIEFRCPNGTLEPVIWQNNVNLFTRLLEYSKKSEFDDDTISKRHYESFCSFLSYKWYNEIYLQQALELCDMIFTNNLDKVYFLRQYLKSFQVGTKELQRPKMFIKD